MSGLMGEGVYPISKILASDTTFMYSTFFRTFVNSDWHVMYILYKDLTLCVVFVYNN